MSDAEIEAIAEVVGKVAELNITPMQAQVVVELAKEASENEVTAADSEGPAAPSAEKLSEMVKEMSEEHEEEDTAVTQSEVKHLAEMAMQLDPELSQGGAEAVSEILTAIGDKTDTKTVEKVTEAVKESPVIKEESVVESMAKQAVKLSKEMSEDELEVVANMLEQIGPTLSDAEGQMIAR